MKETLMGQVRRPVLLVPLTAMLVIVALGAAEGPWKAPAKADSFKNPVQVSEEGLKEGKDLFKKFRCIKCHGEGGRGDGIKGKQLVKTPSDLTGAAARGVQSDGALFWKISEGRKPMPSYEKAATKRQRWLLVNYIRHLADIAEEEKANEAEEGSQSQPDKTTPQESTSAGS